MSLNSGILYRTNWIGHRNVVAKIGKFTLRIKAISGLKQAPFNYFDTQGASPILVNSFSCSLFPACPFFFFCFFPP
jgi:hypothetical protein